MLLRLVSGGTLLLLPLLSNLAGPVQHFRAAILDAWRCGVAAGLCGRAGFRGGPLLDFHGSLQLLHSSHVRERDKDLLRSIMVGGVWNGFLLEKVGRHPAPCRFCGAPDGDGHLFWECTFPPLVEIRESPEFHDLMREDIGLIGPGACSGTAGFPCFVVPIGAPLGLLMLSEAACYIVEAALGRYSSDLLDGWGPFDGYDVVEVASTLPDNPNIWTDGSLV